MDYFYTFKIKHILFSNRYVTETNKSLQNVEMLHIGEIWSQNRTPSRSLLVGTKSSLNVMSN